MKQALHRLLCMQCHHHIWILYKILYQLLHNKLLMHWHNGPKWIYFFIPVWWGNLLRNWLRTYGAVAGGRKTSIDGVLRVWNDGLPHTSVWSATCQHKLFLRHFVCRPFFSSASSVSSIVYAVIYCILLSTSGWIALQYTFYSAFFCSYAVNWFSRIQL